MSFECPGAGRVLLGARVESRREERLERGQRGVDTGWTFELHLLSAGELSLEGGFPEPSSTWPQLLLQKGEETRQEVTAPVCRV